MMRRILAVLAALTVFSIATPARAATAAAAATMTVTILDAPAKIYYNVPFTIRIRYKNTSGAPLLNPHPAVFLYPTPNLPGGHCDPGFRGSMAELSHPTIPTAEHESEGGPTNCHVWWSFDFSHTFPAILNGYTRTVSNVKITAKPPGGITTLNLQATIINPSAPDEPYGSTVVSIPVATLPPPPTPITPTTNPPTPTASPTEEPSASASAEPSATDITIIEPKAKPPVSQGLGWYWIVAGIALITIGAVLLILLFRWRSQPDDLG